MAGYNLIAALRELDSQLDQLGLKMTRPKWADYSADQYVSVMPKDADSLPVYARDVDLFCGSIEQLQTWLRGVEWARTYDVLLSLSNPKRRERKEQDYRNRRLMKLIKDGKKDESV